MGNLWIIYGKWPIEIDGLPNLKMGGFSIASLNNQIAFFCYKTSPKHHQKNAVRIFCDQRLMVSYEPTSPTNRGT